MLESRQAVRTHHDHVGVVRVRVLEDPCRGLALVHHDLDGHIAGRGCTHEFADFGEQAIRLGPVEDDLCRGTHNRRRRLGQVKRRVDVQHRDRRRIPSREDNRVIQCMPRRLG